jgi:hypothetical protein
MRQDAKQFVIMGIAVAELLREFAITSGDERDLVGFFDRLSSKATPSANFFCKPESSH